MKDETIEDQNELIALIEEAGWSISRVETTEHEFHRHENAETTRVAIEIVVSKEYHDGDGFANPYRVK